MADITDPEAVRFSNEKARTAADILAQAYYQVKQVQDEWFATGMSSLIPNTADLIVDGSATDGRHPVTGADVTNIITRCGELVTDYEDASSAKLNTILNVAVNPQR